MSANLTCVPIAAVQQVKGSGPTWWPLPYAPSGRAMRSNFPEGLEQFRLSLGSDGRQRITSELKKLGLNIGCRRIGRLMRENGIRLERSEKYKVTTTSNHIFNTAQNLLNRDFAAGQSNQKWVGDTGCVLTQGGSASLQPLICSPGA